MKSRSLSRVVLGASLALTAVTASAFPIAVPGTEGIKVIASGGAVTATYQGNSASYSNDLYLERLADGTAGLDGIHGNDLFIFNNHGNTPGDSVGIGSFAAGTELVFRLHVNNTGYDYYTGPASRNPDGWYHARVQAGWMPGETLVSFEDLFLGPFDYNDLSFSFQNTTSSGVPEAASTWSLFGLSLALLTLARRRR